MIRYTVTNKSPYGKEYHGPGSTKNRRTLSLYHLSNRLRDWVAARRKGFKRKDIDVMHTRDGVPVVNHSLDAMGKEGFRDRVRNRRKVPRKIIPNLTWPEVKELRTPDGTPISHVRWHFQQAKKYNMIAAVDLKHLWGQREIDQLIQIANEEGVWMYVKWDPLKPHLNRVGKRFRQQGVWARKNGTGKFLKPLG